MANAIADNIAVLRHVVFLRHREWSVLLQPRHEAAAGIIELRPPAIVVITEVVHVGRAGFDRHDFGSGNVVDVGWCPKTTSSPGAFTPGMGRSSTASIRLKIAVLAAIPTPSASTATPVNKGLRRSIRRAKRAS